MKRQILYAAASAIAGLSLMTACDKGVDLFELNTTNGYLSGDYGEGDGAELPEFGSYSGNAAAGVVTAGEWRDLDHWQYWGELVSGQTFGEKPSYWGFYTRNRVSVAVFDVVSSIHESPLAGVKVELLKDGVPVWRAVTDNKGRAELWDGLFDGASQEQDMSASVYTIAVDGKVQGGAPVFSAWDGSGEDHVVNKYWIYRGVPDDNVADIAFIVDATGSMADEIRFLKEDLADIIGKAANMQTDRIIRTAALFYRDESDEYVTRHRDFTADLPATASFVAEQSAEGGGDYPEAVHTALEQSLQSLSWDENAHSRLAFMLLDAPAHHNDEVIRSLHESMKLFAAAGIKLIPIAASGADKNTEFMLRFFAVATGGTYVFITNDSGVGSDHIEASVGDYDVELLNELIVRLISEYIE